MGSFDLLLQPSRAFAFDDLHGVGYRVSGGGQENEVNMVILDVELNDFPVFPLADGFKDPAKL